MSPSGATDPRQSSNHTVGIQKPDTPKPEWFKFKLNYLYLLVDLFIDKLATKTFHTSNQISWLIISTVTSEYEMKNMWLCLSMLQVFIQQQLLRSWIFFCSKEAFIANRTLKEGERERERSIKLNDHTWKINWWWFLPFIFCLFTNDIYKWMTSPLFISCNE